MAEHMRDVRMSLYMFTVVLFFTVCNADPDLFPDEEPNCKRVCNGTNKARCCTQSSGGTDGATGGLSTIDGSTAAIFFATVIGSLATVISLFMCCFKCSKACSLCYKESANRRGSRLRTISAGVQTSEEPPAYEWANPEDDLTQISIPRCPSYVKDPPKYSEHFEMDFLENGVSYGIEISVPSTQDASTTLSVENETEITSPPLPSPFTSPPAYTPRIESSRIGHNTNNINQTNVTTHPDEDMPATRNNVPAAITEHTEENIPTSHNIGNVVHS